MNFIMSVNNLLIILRNCHEMKLNAKIKIIIKISEI